MLTFKRKLELFQVEKKPNAFNQWFEICVAAGKKRSAVNNFFKLLRDFKVSSPLKFTQKRNIIDLNLFFLPFSASGTSAVAIDNKIEQAMVSLDSYLKTFRCLRHFSVSDFSFSPDFL